MQKIDNNLLKKAISNIVNKQDFIVFINDCKIKIDDFRNQKTFTKSLSINGNKQSITVKLSSNTDFKKYLDYLYTNLESIVTCDISNYPKYIKKFNSFFKNTSSNLDVKAFNNKILDVLQYSKLRSSTTLLFDFYKELGIKVCVYCNSQHVILLDKSKMLRLQADHNLPKAKFPYFSISFFNLYPTCNNCNHLKGVKDIKYQLYYVGKQQSDNIEFSISEMEIINLFTTQIDESKFNIVFNSGKTNLENVLNISEIYNNHKDYIVDLMHIYKCYDEKYIQSVKNTFNGLIIGASDDLFNRMLFGITLKNEDINKRVFSKVLIDINQQLELLKTTKKI
ncbi:hypothetical protein [Myroides odoratus]|uniref:hypothetical protein n=1 Tax=Myroides odoratus TaxID=256 RepID=UPI003341C5B1